MSFGPKGKFLIVGATDARLRLFRVDGMKLLRTLKGHKRTLYASTFGPRGRLAATACAAGTLRIWDVTTGDAVHAIAAGGRLNSLAFSPDGSTLLGAGPPGLLAWDTKTGKRREGLVEKPPEKVYMMHLHPDGRQLAVSTPSGLRLYDLKTRRLLRTIPTPPGPAKRRRLYPVALHPTRSLIASASNAGAVFVWNRNTGQLLQWVQAHKGNVFALVFDSKGKVLASGGGDQKIRLFDVR